MKLIFYALVCILIEINAFIFITTFYKTPYLHSIVIGLVAMYLIDVVWASKLERVTNQIGMINV